MNNKIGIGVITCNRIELFRKCIFSVPPAEVVLVVNDGKPYPAAEYPQFINKVVQNKKNLGVARSKNIALQYLVDQKCDHIFLCEDDISILNQNIYNEYIQASANTGIQHFNYAYNDSANRTADGRPNPRKVIECNNISISLNRYLPGAFSYYSAVCLKKAGLMDERYKNAWEHVDHTYKIIKLGMHPPYWWFADLAFSDQLISDLDSGNSIIRKNILWKVKKKYSAILFKMKHSYYPVDVPDTREEEVMKILERLQKNYSYEL